VNAHGPMAGSCLSGMLSLQVSRLQMEILLTMHLRIGFNSLPMRRGRRAVGRAEMGLLLSISAAPFTLICFLEAESPSAGAG
jgi:hypothetical protein